jgi:hypothetical protein
MSVLICEIYAPCILDVDKVLICNECIPVIDECGMRGVVVLVLSKCPFVYDVRITGIIEERGCDEGLDTSVRNKVILCRQ